MRHLLDTYNMKNFMFFQLDRDIDLPSSIRIAVATTEIHKIDTNGVLLGWNGKVRIYGCMEEDKFLITTNFICFFL